jgi:hypothetical protein
MLMICALIIGFFALNGVLTAPVAVVEAQQPITTEEVQPTVQSQQPPVATEVPPGLAVPTETPTEAPTATTPANALGDALPVLVNARIDLELLASDRLGANRPVGWSGSNDMNDPQIALLIRLDLELLVGTTISPDSRPAGWFGAVASSTFAIARDIRHDLELLADLLVEPGVRPTGWVGDDPIMRCNRATQTLVALLERSFRGSGAFVLTADTNAPDFCVQAELEASRFAEINLLSDTAATNSGLLTGSSPGAITPNGRFTIAFLDRDARQRVGIIPEGTQLTVVARSYTTFSAMLLVQGDGFQVFVDYTTTTLTAEQFETLPNVDGIEIAPFCDADWCTSG